MQIYNMKTLISILESWALSEMKHETDRLDCVLESKERNAEGKTPIMIAIDKEFLDNSQNASFKLD